MSLRDHLRNEFARRRVGPAVTRDSIRYNPSQMDGCSALKGLMSLRHGLKSVCLAVAFLLALPAFTQSPPETSPFPAALGEDEVFAKIEALVRDKKFQDADSLFAASSAQFSSLSRACFRIGKIYFDHDEWARAGRWIEKSLAGRGDNDEAHLLLGLVDRQLHRPEEAEHEFTRAAILSPGNEVNAYFAGLQLVLDQKFEAALSYLYTAVQLNAGDPGVYRALGMAQFHLGNYGLAESYYRKAIDVADDSLPADARPYLDLAFILLLGHDAGKIEEAFKLADRAAEIQPDSGEAHYLEGKALMKMGRVKEAVPELERAAQRNPDDSKAHFQLAEAYEALGEKGRARAERQALAQTKRRANQQGMASGNVLPGVNE
jgi:tetratricopeptide (TPR) repeat protein